MASDRKAYLIYDAVYSAFMDLRVDLRMHPPANRDALDERLFRAMNSTATAAVDAYTTPLRAKGGTNG